MGALVLLVAGVIGFPLLFETQPRPLPVDTPIVTPAREVSMPAPLASAPPVASPADAASAAPTVAAAPASAAVAVPAVGPASSASAAVAAAPAPAPAPAARASERAHNQGSTKGHERSAAAHATASAASATGRFVVQVGAYTDAATLRDARAKVERLGLKTYTQVIEADNGKRTRVRVGPFVSREEAQSVVGKLKGAGLPANILAL